MAATRQRRSSAAAASSFSVRCLSERAAFAALAGCAAAASAAERTRLGQLASPPLLALALGAAVSPALPAAATEAATAAVWTHALPLSVACSLLSSDLRALRGLGAATAAFGLATAGAVAGTALSYSLVGGALGADGARLAACLCASYVGGSVNFAAVASASGLLAGGQAVASGAMAADNAAMALFLAALLALGRRLPPQPAPAAAAAEPAAAPLTVAGCAATLAAALACVWAGEAAAALAGGPAAQLAYVGLAAGLCAAAAPRLAGRAAAPPFPGAEAAGGCGLLLFFASLGLAMRDIGMALQAGPPLFAFIALLLAVQMAMTLALGRAAGLPPRLLLLAANAAVGGPATAAAMAAALGWRDLVQPALLLGSLGYLVGTPLGLGMLRLLGC